MTPATYRDLIAQATQQIADGRRATTLRMDGRDTALTVITDRHAVLSALEAHVWALTGPGRAASVRSALRPDPIESAALHLADTITKTVGAERPHPSLLTGPHGAWGRAAQSIRAATDLLAVHHAPTGSARSPSARILESTDARDAALAHVATLASTTASVEDALALRVGQTGVPWATVRSWLPGMQDITTAALDLAQATDTPNPRPLPDIGLIATGVRTDDVYVELADRFARLRQRAWDLVQSPDRSVATLRYYATIGIAVHAHAAAFHTGPLGPASTLITRARTWQGLSTHLAALISPAPHDADVRADLTALARLLPAVAPLCGPGRAHDSDPATRRTGAILGGAVQLMTEVAVNNARTFATIARTHCLYVPARVLTGDEITDNPDLVHARLDGKLAPAPERMFDDVTRLYQDLRSHPSPTPALGPAPGLTAANRTTGPEPVGMTVSA